MDTKKFYSRKDIQKEIVKLAKNREVAVKFPKGYGRRPDTLMYESDISEFAKQGATSFHVSEERWSDPMQLKPGMPQKQLDKLRIGWDCILDVDTNFLDYAREATMLILEALKFHDVSASVKFSGRSGFHIAIPFEAFPSEVHSQKTKFLFPEGTRIMANYLKHMIKDHLTERILSLTTIKELSKATKKEIKEPLDPFQIADIDSVLISSRHMFRSVYSFNEKSGLVSIPVKNPKTFKLSQAKPQNVTTDLEFLNLNTDASSLIIQAFDWNQKQKKPEVLKKKIKTEIPKIAIKDKFPPCIELALKGMPDDGRKRAIFILLNFLKHMGWSYESIEKKFFEWNKNNYEPLREGYIRAQINWHKKQNESILPPNCTNDSYYKGLAICKPDNWCKLIKNPVQYVKRKIRVLNENKPKKKK